MKYLVQKKQLEVGSSIHMYSLYVDGDYILGSTIEETVMSVFREFCNAKAAGALHSKNKIIVCQFISPKGHYRITKKYSYFDKVQYVIYKKCWFFWLDVFTFTKCSPHDTDMPIILQNYVNEGIASTTVPTTVAEC